MPDRHLPDVPPSDWYRITNASSGKTKTARVDIYDVIGWDESAKEFVGKLNALDVDRIDLHLNSPGGDVFDGIAILNALRDHPARVVSTVDGMAASAASFIAMSGDDIVMNRNSEMMIHDAAGIAVGNSETMKDLAQRLDKVSDNIASIYAERAGGTVEDWRTAMRAETWYSAQEAVDAGLADRIAERVDHKAETVKNHFDVSVFNYAGRQAAPPPVIPSVPARTQTPEPAGPGTTKEGGAVADNAKLREALGLKADASDDEVRNALASTGLVNTAPDPTPDPAPKPPAPQPDGDPQPEPTAEPGSQELDQKIAAAAANQGVITLDATQAAHFQETKRRFAALEAKLDERDRDETITDAIKAGKFPPSRRKHYEAYWTADREGAKTLIASLTPNFVPVNETGYAGDGSEDALWRSEFGSLFPPEITANGRGR